MRGLGFDLPVSCPRNGLHVADSRGRGKPRPYQVLHDTKKQASLSHRIEAKQSDRTEVASGELAKPSSRLRLVLRRVFRNDANCSRVSQKTGRGKPRPYDGTVFKDKQAPPLPRWDTLCSIVVANDNYAGSNIYLARQPRRGRACPARNVQQMHNPILLPQRKQLRLRGCDYAFPGAYFVTICSAGKRPVFGSISGESIVLSPAGEIVRSEWIALPERFSRLVLDEFVIMPNHLHGVLAFVGHAGGASPSPTTGNTTTKPGGASPSPTLFEVIGAFKSISTIKVNRLLGRRGVPLWQRSYYEHVVRTGEDLRNIQRYISENPLMWSLDPENPNRKSS